MQSDEFQTFHVLLQLQIFKILIADNVLQMQTSDYS